MLKKFVAIAATTAAMLTGAVAMSGSAEAHRIWIPGHHGNHHWNHRWNHGGWSGVGPWYGYGPVFGIYGGYPGYYGDVRCRTHFKWRHHHRVKVRVCRPIYW